MSLKIGDKVLGAKFDGEEYNCGWYDFMEETIGLEGFVTDIDPEGWNKPTACVDFEGKGSWYYPIEVLTVVNEKEKIVKKQKSVSEFKVAAYAVVNTENGEVFDIEYNREDARRRLQWRKAHPRDSFKIIKLQPEKFIR